MNRVEIVPRPFLLMWNTMCTMRQSYTERMTTRYDVSHLPQPNYAIDERTASKRFDISQSWMGANFMRVGKETCAWYEHEHWTIGRICFSLEKNRIILFPLSLNHLQHNPLIDCNQFFEFFSVTTWWTSRWLNWSSDKTHKHFHVTDVVCLTWESFRILCSNARCRIECWI